MKRLPEARRAGCRTARAATADTYPINDEEWAAVREGLEQAERGDFVSDEELAAFFKRHGL